MIRSNAGMAWAHVGRVVLLVHAPRKPTEAEWDEVMASAAFDDARGVVVIANGVRPSPRQRSHAQQKLGKELPLAVVTDSVVALGAVTAISWFGINVRAFVPSDLRAALEFAGVSPSDVSVAQRLLEEMNQKVAA